MTEARATSDLSPLLGEVLKGDEPSAELLARYVADPERLTPEERALVEQHRAHTPLVEDQIRALRRLTGHDGSRAVATDSSPPVAPRSGARGNPPQRRRRRWAAALIAASCAVAVLAIAVMLDDPERHPASAMSQARSSASDRNRADDRLRDLDPPRLQASRSERAESDPAEPNTSRSDGAPEDMSRTANAASNAPDRGSADVPSDSGAPRASAAAAAPPGIDGVRDPSLEKPQLAQQSDPQPGSANERASADAKRAIDVPSLFEDAARDASERSEPDPESPPIEITSQIVLAQLQRAERGASEATSTVDVDIRFAAETAALTEEGRRALREVGRALVDDALDGYRFELEVHTDVEASDAANQRLSDARARVLRDELVAEFEALTGRIDAIGRGNRERLVAGQSDASRSLNQRVTLKGVASR